MSLRLSTMGVIRIFKRFILTHNYADAQDMLAIHIKKIIIPSLQVIERS